LTKILIYSILVEKKHPGNNDKRMDDLSRDYKSGRRWG